MVTEILRENEKRKDLKKNSTRILGKIQNYNNIYRVSFEKTN